MIEIKMVFPSYEAAISALAACRALGTEGKAETPKPAAKTEPDPKPTKAEAKAAEKAKAAETPPTAATAPTAASPTPPTESPSPGTSSGATKEQVTEAITAAVKTDRQKVVDTLTSFGAKSGKDLKPEQYHDFLVKLSEAMKPDDLA
jgi:cytoskeletal protein RodZ